METCPAFIDETGVLTGSRREQPLYGIGALVVPDTKGITNGLSRLHFNLVAERNAQRGHLRRQIEVSENRPTLAEIDSLMSSTRHHEYKFNDITRFNVQQYIDLLNFYFEYPDVQFHAMILDRLAPGYSLARWDGDVWLAYSELTRELLQQQLDRDVFVITDLQDKPDNSPVYLEDILCTVPAVKGCLRAVSELSVYLQLADLLLGCVQFDWKDANDYYGSTSGKAAAKRIVTNFVKSRLGLRPSEVLIGKGETARRWSEPSLFTISKGDW